MLTSSEIHHAVGRYGDFGADRVCTDGRSSELFQDFNISGFENREDAIQIAASTHRPFSEFLSLGHWDISWIVGTPYRGATWQKRCFFVLQKIRENMLALRKTSYHHCSIYSHSGVADLRAPIERMVRTVDFSLSILRLWTFVQYPGYIIPC